MQFAINPQIDIDAIREKYQVDNRVPIEQFIVPEQASELSDYMQNKVDYDQAYFVDGQYHQTSFEKLKRLEPNERRALMTKIYRQAAEGVGFWYGRQRILHDSGDLSEDFYTWLNSEETLATIRKITGIESIRAATSQLTRYMPGDFLTRHNDVVEKEKRRVAYAYYLTPTWHPDWGGLLQFYEQSGRPRDTWAPFFNSISLFDVKHIHAVTSVVPFSPMSRLAISGWFVE